MAEKWTETEFAGRKVVIYNPEYSPVEARRTVLLHDGEEAIRALRPFLDASSNSCDALMVFLYPQNRLNEYTPWPAKAISNRFSDFGGQGLGYITELEQRIVPWLCNNFGANHEHLALMGYSLGGLISAYALTVQDCWQDAIILCGSFWYDGWIEYLSEHPSVKKARVLLLYGEHEGYGKPGRLASAAENAQQTAELMKKSTDLTVTYDSGGHHSNVDLRYQKGLAWLLEKR